MDFEPTDEQRAIRETARAFAADHFAPHAARWDAEEIFPEAELRAAAALGLAGIYVRDDVGGSGVLIFSGGSFSSRWRRLAATFT